MAVVLARIQESRLVDVAQLRKKLVIVTHGVVRPPRPKDHVHVIRVMKAQRDVLMVLLSPRRNTTVKIITQPTKEYEGVVHRLTPTEGDIILRAMMSPRESEILISQRKNMTSKEIRKNAPSKNTGRKTALTDRRTELERTVNFEKGANHPRSEGKGKIRLVTMVLIRTVTNLGYDVKKNKTKNT